MFVIYFIEKLEILSFEESFYFRYPINSSRLLLPTSNCYNYCFAPRFESENYRGVYLYYKIIFLGLLFTRILGMIPPPTLLDS